MMTFTCHAGDDESLGFGKFEFEEESEVSEQATLLLSSMFDIRAVSAK